MGRFYGIPETKWGWLSFITGILSTILYATQFVLDWFGKTSGDKALYSILVLFLSIFACASGFAANKSLNLNGDYHTARTVLRITVIGFGAVIIIILALNNGLIMMDSNYAKYAAENEGMATGFRQLTSVTREDVNSLENWALGVRQIVRSMFLVVPCLIATWSGLGVLTADGISDAEGGILGVVAAFIVFLIVWIFKAIDVTLMFMSLIMPFTQIVMVMF